VLDIINSIIRNPVQDYIDKDCTEGQIADLLTKAFTLVGTMLDDNDLTTVRLAKQVVTILDLEAVFEKMVPSRIYFPPSL